MTEKTVSECGYRLVGGLGVRRLGFLFWFVLFVGKIYSKVIIETEDGESMLNFEEKKEDVMGHLK